MKEPALTSNHQLMLYKTRQFIIFLVVINQLFTYHRVLARSKGLIYNRDGKFIYRPSRSNQGHIIVIDDRHKDVAQRSTSESFYQPALQYADQRYLTSGGTVIPANQVQLISLVDLQASANNDQARSLGYNRVGLYPAQLGTGGLASTPLLAAQGSNTVQLLPLARLYSPSQLGSRMASRAPVELVGAPYSPLNQKSIVVDNHLPFDHHVQDQQSSFVLPTQRSRHFEQSNHDQSFTIEHPASLSALLDEPNSQLASPSARSLSDTGYAEDTSARNLDPESDEFAQRPTARQLNRVSAMTPPIVPGLLESGLITDESSRPDLSDRQLIKGGRHSKQAFKSKYAETRKHSDKIYSDETLSHWKHRRE